MAGTRILNAAKKKSITGKRREDFESRNLHHTYQLWLRQLTRISGLRTTKGPRYLFRAWNMHSTGAPDDAINTDIAIHPPRFMPKFDEAQEQDRLTFYATPENVLHQMVGVHYGGQKDIFSGFSSWAASLHLVLLYAKALGAASNIAVLDTHDLEVRCWFGVSRIS